jgi:hypothetical protein
VRACVHRPGRALPRLTAPSRWPRRRTRRLRQVQTARRAIVGRRCGALVTARVSVCAGSDEGSSAPAAVS